MSDSPSGQSRTPSHLKWLLNERAMLAGEILRRETHINSLLAEVRQLRARVEALDCAMALFNDRVDPEAAGVVKATKERYGSRGGLKRFLLEDLEQAGDEGRDTILLTIRAAAKFEVPIFTLADRTRYGDTISWTLRYLRGKGLVENVYQGKGGHTPSIWRIARGPCLADLRALALNHEGEANG